MSYASTRYGKQQARTVTLLANGTTVGPSPFTDAAEIDALAELFQGSGPDFAPGDEAADSTGTLYLMYGFGSYGNNGYG